MNTYGADYAEINGKNVTREELTELLRNMNDLQKLEQIVARAENMIECEQIKLDL